MKIYDISQEVFHCEVFPGDIGPERMILGAIRENGYCNITGLSMCAHNGTHVDAPYHFYDGGKTVDRLDLSRLVGKCFVAFAEGPLSADGARAVLEKARRADPEAARRILLGGKMFVTPEAAKVFADAGTYLLGNESQTVGPEDAPAAVHYTLLAAEVVLLEGIRLRDVGEGVYFLNAAPLNLGGADGAPCRALLVVD